MTDNAAQTPGNLAAAGKADYREIVNELREQNFDTVRFATYRTACKLRFVQKKFHLHLVDIWNIIESFRENGLNAVEYVSEIKISRIELLLSTIYHNLNKRLPIGQQMDTDKAINLLLSFLLAAYDRDNVGKVRIFSIKVSLASLCAGKLIDKLRYIFSQISTSDGILDHRKFSDYLKEVLSLPTAIFEGPTFGFSDACIKQCFDESANITINTFLDALMADPCPPCLMWLPLLHRMASVERVFHPVVCDACRKDSFTGFRYKCQRCHNYQLCQECFWRGRVSGPHTNQHEMKEYSSYKSPTKQLSHSIGKSLQCIPHHNKQREVSRTLEEPERPFDLSNVVPSSPSLARYHAVQQQRLYGSSGLNFDEATLNFSPIASSYLRFHQPRTCSSLPSSGRSPVCHDNAFLDDEHKLIARYSTKLAGCQALSAAKDFSEQDEFGQRTMVAKLEQKNKEILREIQRLQAMQAASTSAAGSLSTAHQESGLSVELDTLRHRKYELECRMQQLQDTRHDLLGQLENIMRVLKEQTPKECSRSPDHASSLSSISGAATTDVKIPFKEQQQAPSVIAGSIVTAPSSTQPQTVGALRRGPAKQADLLNAANSIADTMSTLVKELGSDDDAVSNSEEDRIKPHQLSSHEPIASINGQTSSRERRQS